MAFHSKILLVKTIVEHCQLIPSIRKEVHSHSRERHEEFVCMMYMNYSTVRGAELPPSDDLSQHMLRVRYETYIMKRTHHTGSLLTDHATTGQISTEMNRHFMRLHFHTNSRNFIFEKKCYRNSLIPTFTEGMSRTTF